MKTPPRLGDDAEEAFVRALCLRAIACARDDGAPFTDADEQRVRAYFARQRRSRSR